MSVFARGLASLPRSMARRMERTTAANCVSPNRVLPSVRRHLIAGGSFMSERDGSNGLLWFLAGLGIGAVAGILYAPRSGNETREALRSRAEEGREYVRNRAREAREQAAEWADRG